MRSEKNVAFVSIRFNKKSEFFVVDIFFFSYKLRQKQEFREESISLSAVHNYVTVQAYRLHSFNLHFINKTATTNNEMGIFILIVFIVKWNI